MRRIVIADRGVGAIRAARAIRDHGASPVAVYTPGDMMAAHIRAADEARALARGDYQDPLWVADAAARAGADAVYPGRGLWTFDPACACSVEREGLAWIGSPPKSLEPLFERTALRRAAADARVPFTPGAVVRGAVDALRFGERRGYPLAITSEFRGAPKRVAWRADEVPELYDTSRREALSEAAVPLCRVESHILGARLIEAVVAGDSAGALVVAGLRECSLGRRGQALVAEAPAPFLADDLRERITRGARAIWARMGLQGIGSVSFAVKGKAFWFLDAQVGLSFGDAAVEAAAGIDLAVEALRLADGKPLSFAERQPRGHAIELRITAEDAAHGFLPTPGRLAAFAPPSGPGIRVDAGVAAGSTVPQDDPLLAALTAAGSDRAEALARIRRALAEFEVAGVATLLSLYRALFADAAWDSGHPFDREWLETEFAAELPPQPRIAPPEPDDHQELRRRVIVDGRNVDVRLHVC
jgi:acetyl-CoA/propionyl-CoA carboxylase biotin carboxyl carrier protein